MQVAILCGGKATRMYPLTKDIPKSLITIKGKPFLFYQIQLLRKHGFNNIILCTGIHGEQIKNYIKYMEFGINITISEELTPMGTGGALYNARNLLDDSFWIMYGDSYLLTDLKKIKYDSGILMTIYKNENPLHSNNISIDGRCNYIDYGFIGMDKSYLEPSCDLKDIINKHDIIYLEVNESFYEIGTPERLQEFKDYVDTL
jgi:NDP-sugar pyrophosphorylase family protein